MSHSIFNRIQTVITSFVIAVVVGVSCGPSLDGDLTTSGGSTTGKKKETTTTTQAATNKEPERVVVPVKIYYDDGLGLTDVTAAVSYQISLVGCASGFTQTSSTTIAPYRFDVGCYAKLTQFVYDGTDNYTYNQTASGATAFTDTFAGYAAGSQAVFATADAAPTHKTLMRVYVEQALTNAITGSEAVIYHFSHVTQGSTSTVLKSTIDRAGTTATVTSVAPPSFTISSVSLVNVTSNGAGEWQFVLQCTAAVTGSADDRICAQIDMYDKLRFKLITDSYSSSMTVAQLETAFGVLAGSGSPIASGDIHSAGTTTTNGGFRTPNTAESNVATGPNQMHNNPNMILILRSEGTVAGEYSWQYFNVDIDVNN